MTSESRGKLVHLSSRKGELPHGFETAYMRPEDKAYLNQIANFMAEKIMETLVLWQEHKELYTVEDLADRYGLKPATIKAKIMKGEFGDTVNLGAKVRLVTRAGLLAYEAAHTGPAQPQHTATPPRRAKKNRENPGKI